MKGKWKKFNGGRVHEDRDRLHVDTHHFVAIFFLLFLSTTHRVPPNIPSIPFVVTWLLST